MQPSINYVNLPLNTQINSSPGVYALKYKAKVSFSAFVVSALLSPQLFAVQELDYFDMSIEQLLNVETTVASISSESISSTPSVVTSFSKEEISSLGVSDLYDLMNYVPGFQSVTGEFISSHKKLQSRGVYLDSGYVLIMINGVRLNEFSFGKASVYTPVIDLSMAEKVEVIRGPGSEIYGSNAFLGVVNITTKKANEVSYERGTNDHQKLSASLNKKLDFGQLSMNMMLMKGDGEHFSNSLWQSKENLSQIDLRKPYRHYQFTIDWQEQGYYLQYMYDNHQLDSFLNLEGYHPDNRFESQNQYVKGGYGHKFNDQLELDFDVSFGDHIIESTGFIQSGGIAPFSEDFLLGPNWATRNIAVNTSLSYQWSPKLNVNLGLEWQKSHQYKAGVFTSHITPDGNSTLPLDIYYLDKVQRFETLGDYDALNQKLESLSFYGQVKFQVSSKGVVNLGGRYGNYKHLDNEFSPRVSYIHQLNPSNQFKLMYSEAYREPVTNELYSDDGVTLGNNNLLPEKVMVLQGQWLRKAQTWSTEVTAFHNTLTNLITSMPIDQQGRTMFMNTGKEEVTGVEALAHYQLNKYAKVRATATQYLSDTVENSYDHFATLALLSSYEQWKLGLNVIYRPSVAVSEGYRLNTTETVFEQPSVSIMNLTAAYQLGRSINFSLVINNVFDEKYEAYEPRQNKNDYGIRQSGRMVKFEVKYQY